MTDADPRFVPGEPAPWFHAKALDGNQRFAFNTVAGRPVLLLFLGSASIPAAAPALAVVAQHRALFDDVAACFFGVSVDPADVAERRIAQELPGIRWFVDDDRAISRAYHAAVPGEGGQGNYRPHWLVLDRTLRIVGGFAIDRGEEAVAALRALIARTDEPAIAPALIVPRVFEPGFCRALIDAYEREGGRESGFMRDVDGVTVEQFDHEHKRRRDYVVGDETLQQAIHARLKRLLVPMIQRAFQFEVTRVERLLVARYDSDEGGHFRAHRDNTTHGTAHRRFACTINLNAEEYEGGDLCFPEFGQRTYRAPTGGAVIFSCSLLHEARPVTKGRRYAFLPFFYDEAAARLREANLSNVAPELQHYRAG